MTQFELLASFLSDRSTWVDLRHYPATHVCRRMIRLADAAAANGKRWRGWRLIFEAPELSYREIGFALGVSHTTVMTHALPVDLSDPEEFTDAERPWGDPPPRTPKVPQRFDAETASLTYRRASRLASFAAECPLRWRALRLHHLETEITQAEIAKMLGISQATVSGHLQPIDLTEAADWPDDDI